jgi:hypothetical protein
MPLTPLQEHRIAEVAKALAHNRYRIARMITDCEALPLPASEGELAMWHSIAREIIDALDVIDAVVTAARS